jgi:hypothetical protein
MDVPFQGSTLIIPGAYYADNVSAALPANAPVTPPLLFVGFGYGPKPLTINQFSSTQDLQTALRGGPASAFIPFIATPSPQLNGAQIVTFIDVSSNTQSTINLTGGTGATNVLALTSDLYGLPSNLLQTSVSTSSYGAVYTGNTNAAASRLLTIYDGYTGTTVQQDNLGIPFQVAYTGAASAASYTVTATGGVATKIVLTSSNPGESVTVPISSGAYQTISQVVSYIEGTGFWTANTLTNGDLPATNLDAGSGVLPVPSGSTLTYGYPSATLGDVVWWINNHAGNLATASVSGSPTAGPASALTALPLTHFTGGQSIPPTTSSYASGLTVALSTAAWTVITDTAAPAAQQLMAQHALLASEPGYGKWRRAVTGSNLGDSVSTTLTNAAALNVVEATYVYPGIQRADPVSGQIINRPGLYAAAAVAAMMTGNGANVPLTNKALVASGMELNNNLPVSLTLSQIDQLQQGGVMPIAVLDNTRVPKVVSDFTTWLIDDNPENVFNQQIAERFYLAYTMVNTLQPYVGTTADPYDEMKILNAAKAALNNVTYSQGNPTGVISSWDPSTLALVYSGSNQVAAITVNAVLVGQNRFITCVVNVLALNISITASST